MFNETLKYYLNHNISNVHIYIYILVSSVNCLSYSKFILFLN